MTKCLKCETDNVANSLFCIKCGAIINGEKYQDQELLKSYSDKIQNFIKELKNTKEEDFIAPLSELKPTFNKVGKLHSLLLNYKKTNDKNPEIDNLIKKSLDFTKRDNSFEIAFVGTVKAGKSTLINALLKQNFASTSVTPETAVLSKFKYGKTDSIKVSFYTKDEWQRLWKSVNDKHAKAFLDEFKKLNAEQEIKNYVGKEPKILQLDKDILKKYTGSTDAAHYFVKEVEISFSKFPFENNIVFVDTPGLDDVVDFRSQITRDYIDRANVVLMCIKADPIHNSEFNTINKIFDNTGGHPEKVFLLGTQYDTKNDPQKDWEDLRKDWEKVLISDRETEHTTFNSELAKTNIIPVAAYVSLLCDMEKEGNLNDEEKRNLKNISYKLFGDDNINKYLNEIYNFANINNVRKSIEKFANSTQQMIINDAKQSYRNLFNEINEYFKNNLEGLKQAYQTSQGDVEEIMKNIDKAKDELKNLEEQKKEFDTQIKKFETQTQNMLDEFGKEIDKIIQKVGA